MAADDAQYLLPVGATIASFSGVLADRVGAVAGSASVVRRTYMDTFDGKLHRKDLELVHDDGALRLLGPAGEELAAAPGEPGARLFAADVAPGPLRDALLARADVRALLPTASIRMRRLPLRILDGEGKTVVRLELTGASLLVGGRARGALTPRLAVTAVRGYDKALAGVRAVLEGDLALTEAGATLHDEAVVAAGGQPGGASSKLDVDVRTGQRADAATASVLEHLLATIDLNLPGTLDDVDTEFLHDFRVAVRRTRSVQRQMRGVFPPAELARARREFRRLQQITGPVRDLDVHLLDVDELIAAGRSELTPVRVVLDAHRRRERARMVRGLRSAPTRRTLDDWRALVAALPDRPEDDRPDAARAIETCAAERIAHVYGRMLRNGNKIDDAAPPEALHELRKSGKELRYLLELFGGLFPDEVTKPLVRALKDLQDTLGRFQDREVQAEELRGLADDVAAREGGAEALLAVGALVADLAEQQARGARRVRRALRRLLEQARAPHRAGGVRLMRVLATYNVKGGVGKTSAAVNLAYLAARGGARTLLWDLDPQGASTYLFRIKPRVRGGAGKLVRGKSEVGALIKGTDHERLDLLPADFSYRHMDLALDATKRPTQRLRRVLEPLADEYDYVFLDCPPSISLVSESVFDAADVLLVPIVPATLSSRTFAQLQSVLADAPRRPQVLAFLSMVDTRKRLHRDVVAELAAAHPELLSTAIPAAADVERMGLQRTVLAEAAPRGRAALAYEALWAEISERIGAAAA